jgi:putative sterol carrier protein
MGDAVERFFEGIPARGHEVLEATTGTMRFDLEDGSRVEHWHVAVRRGEIKVTRRNLKADTTVRMDRTLFLGLIAGRVNAMTALLRGTIAAEGRVSLLLRFLRVVRASADTRAVHGRGDEAS